jgi:flavin reductase (DIM6/NTAB) family NADH-FMN oxidoreductase RutF
MQSQRSAAMPIDPRDYRRALGQFPTGVTIVTARNGQGRYIGLTANSFTSVSLDPALVSWSLRLSSALFEVFDQAGHFGVNVLAASQAGLAARFATRCDDRFRGVAVIEGIVGLPLIAGSLATFECTNLACHVAGDHGIFIGKVERYTSAQRAEPPLVFCQGGYTAPALAT